MNTEYAWRDYNLDTKKFEYSVGFPDSSFIEHLKAVYSITKKYGFFRALKFDFGVTFELWGDLEEGRLGFPYRLAENINKLEDKIRNSFKKKKVA